MTARRLGFGILGVLALGLSLIPELAHCQPLEPASARCQALQADDFSKIPDAPTQVTGVKMSVGSDGAGGYCEVSGYVAPSIGFLLRMPPDHWNGKFIEIGCGGSCGHVAFISQCPLNRGYACIVSDGGHRSSMSDAKWAYNNPQAAIDYLVRAPHLTALAGKAIVHRFYAQGPRKSYFMGCSAGGAQAFSEAQRFPWDFDGVVAGSPSSRASDFLIRSLWARRAFKGPDGESLLGPADLELLHRAVVAKCDMNDGIKDGLIGDPRACHLNLAELRCTPGKTDRCLSATQIAAIDKVYKGPMTSKGEQIAIPSAMMGSELNWSVSYATPGLSDYAADWFRYYFLQPNPGPGWKAEDFDFEQDYRRLGLGQLMEATNPDLRRFKASGAKLLIYSGWNDEFGGALDAADYYEGVERFMGGRAATQDFVRLFTIPGMNHCSGGEGAFAVDYLSYLEAWVERGEAPEKLVAAHVKAENPYALQYPLDPAAVEFSRPVYPYPIATKYSGHGDPHDARSFVSGSP